MCCSFGRLANVKQPFPAARTMLADTQRFLSLTNLREPAAIDRMARLTMTLIVASMRTFNWIFDCRDVADVRIWCKSTISGP
jgi:hypothetical protein